MNDIDDSRQPIAVLKSEHVIILRVIDVLERLIGREAEGRDLEHAALRECVSFFRLFADACHHAKEEDLLFPVLESRGIPRDGGPIGVMLYEHRQARQLTKEMGDALDGIGNGDPGAQEGFLAAARSYIELLRNHIYKEDNILFNMGDRVMSEQDQKTLCNRFCEVACQAFEGKKREELMRMADALEQQWPA